MNAGQARYVLDAGVFIQAARHYYAFDIAPGFWQALIHHAQAGTVLSIDRVKTHEIDKGKDELKNWANRGFQSWFAATADDDVIAAYGQLMQWAYNQSHFTDAAKAEFADEGNVDAWVVAYGLAKGAVRRTTRLATECPSIKVARTSPSAFHLGACTAPRQLDSLRPAIRLSVCARRWAISTWPPTIARSGAGSRR